MKKLLALLLAVLMVASLCACNKDSAESEPTTAPTTAPSDPSDPSTPTEPSNPSDPWADYEIITIAQALELCGEPGNLTTERYYIAGTVISMDNALYGAMTIQDETGTISVYGTYSADGELKYSELENKAYKGDIVLLHCTLQNYNGTKEVKNARLIDFRTVEPEINEDDYTACTIAEARNVETGAKVKVSGVVARITYANGMIPSGFFLIDNTNSIYVYDRDVAARVSEGNQITILAAKDFWILADEQYNADKFGYKGCNQLTECTLVSNDGGSNAFDTSWITESTVKEIMDTPVAQDITTTIFKVNALVKKAPGTGFVNYYINDLDETTGSYVYTQCNGSDFGWMDAYDGKICTVYLAVINAKSTTSGCVYRFIPVLVEDNNFDVSTVDAAQFAVTYFGLPQFMTSYSGNPNLELLTSVSSQLLGIENVALSYASSDASIIDVTGNVLTCKASGTATITVTATYGDKTATGEIAITVEMSGLPEDALNVSGAISAGVGDIVVVKGVVGPSLVNRSGFYLMDETGMIAIITDEATLATLQPGQTIALEGKRHVNTKGGSGYYGQTCLTDCKVLGNLYGNTPYVDSYFVTDKTLADFYALDPNVDYTTTAFRLTATVTVEESKYYTNIYLTDGSTQVRLYCSSANQYNWLKAFAGQEVTVEVAACNWNDKSYYTGCVLAVVDENGNKTINTLNFSN